MDSPNFTAEDRQEIEGWLKSNEGNLPEAVAAAIRLALITLDKCSGSSRQKAREILKQLRLAMGIDPSSEKRKNSGDPFAEAPKGSRENRPKNKKEKLALSKENHDRLQKWHKNLSRKHKGKLMDIDKKLMSLDDIKLTPQEEAEIEQESREHFERAQLGNGADPVYETPRETLICGNLLNVEESCESVNVDPNLLSDKEVCDRFVDERSRFDFSINITHMTLEVERVVVKDSSGEKTVISANTAEIGPPKMKVTWEFLANIMIMVAQYAMPMNRLSAMLSTIAQPIGSGQLSRYFQYIAEWFLPIYLHLGKQLAQAPVINADDTSTRVLEINKSLKQRAEKIITENKLPWSSYSTKENAEKEVKTNPDPGLGPRIAEVFGFSFAKRNEPGELKIKFNTSLLMGRSEPDEPCSTIAFYRSHLGHCGNLLDIILEWRSDDNKSLVIQSDLFAANLVVNPKLTSKINIDYAGCAAHARRVFAQYEDDDKDNCSHMLHTFLGLFIQERTLDLYGRNRDNTSAIRAKDTHESWELILEIAHRMNQKWSKETKLGDAARYIIKNYKKLTYYINDPRVGPTNNCVERLLRLEKTIEKGSFFRKSLEGRFALDICRTILQTATASNVLHADYIKYVLRAPRDEIRAHPENFTPLAYRRMIERSSATAEN